MSLSETAFCRWKDAIHLAGNTALFDQARENAFVRAKDQNGRGREDDHLKAKAAFAAGHLLLSICDQR